MTMTFSVCHLCAGRQDFFLQSVFSLVFEATFALRRRIVSPGASLSSCLQYVSHLNLYFTEASNLVTPGPSAFQVCFSGLMRSNQIQQAVSLALKIKFFVPISKSWVGWDINHGRLFLGKSYSKARSSKIFIQKTLLGLNALLAPAMLCEIRQSQSQKESKSLSDKNIYTGLYPYYLGGRVGAVWTIQIAFVFVNCLISFINFLCPKSTTNGLLDKNGEAETKGNDNLNNF